MKPFPSHSKPCCTPVVFPPFLPSSVHPCSHVPPPFIPLHFPVFPCCYPLSHPPFPLPVCFTFFPRCFSTPICSPSPRCSPSLILPALLRHIIAHLLPLSPFSPHMPQVETDNRTRLRTLSESSAVTELTPMHIMGIVVVVSHALQYATLITPATHAANLARDRKEKRKTYLLGIILMASDKKRSILMRGRAQQAWTSGGSRLGRGHADHFR